MEDVHKLKEKILFTGMLVIPAFFCFFVPFLYPFLLSSLSSKAVDTANG
jgi:hypothetical protein